MFQVPQPILVCTYTNVAVDNLVEGFAKAGVKPLRIGQSAHVRQSLIEHSLDYKLQQHPLHAKLMTVLNEDEEINAAMKELSKKYGSLELRIKETANPRRSTLARAQNMKSAISSMVYRQKMLKKKIYGLQQLMLRDTVAAADVVCVELLECYVVLSDSLSRFARLALLRLAMH